MKLFSSKCRLAKLCHQRRLNGYAFCIRHILEDKSAPFKQCAHVARYNKQNCTNPIPSNENREFCNSHMQVAGILPKRERKKKEKEKEVLLSEGRLKFSDRLKALLTKENSVSCNEDTFNSDDPYAFPDTISDHENGCIAFSQTSILRSAWNCSQKSLPDVSSVDSPLRCDQPSKIAPSNECKLKSNTPTLSQTMNRLHAKIAQNKLLDKQKKIQDSSLSTISLINAQLQAISNLKCDDPMSPTETNSINSESNDSKRIPEIIKDDVLIKCDSLDENGRSEDSITSNFVSSPNPPSITQGDSRMSSGMNSCSSDKYFCEPLTPPAIDSLSDFSPKDFSCKEKLEDETVIERMDDTVIEKPKILDNSKTPIVLRKLQRIFKKKKKQNKYIFPSGIYSSESDSSDSEDERNLFSQLSRFCIWDQQTSSSLQNMKSESRTAKQSQLKTELLRSYYHLCCLHSIHKREKEHQFEVIQPLVEAARAYPNRATEILSNYLIDPSNQKKSDKPNTAAKTPCSFKQESVACTNAALPYTWHCKKHITYNVDQLLFERCTAKFSDNTPCCVPVFDVCHELPLCFEHAKKRDNYDKMASEPKPKKPRKKPKPSALTRPPKRGKKKKKPSSVRPSTPLPPPSVLPSAAMPSSSHQIEMPNVNSFSNEVIKSVETILPVPELNKVMNGELHTELESDLEDFSPGAIEKSLGLQLDTADLANHATKLLEEHDFTEVLNKIPDDAFNDLFVDTRNGEYIPSREETEELERALAAVSKDVHLAKESLAKLSSSTIGPDLEELERSLEIHGSLLGADNLTSAIDENSFADLPNNNNHIDTLNVISSSFSTSDLNSFTQALSESLDQNHLPSVTESSLLSNSINVPLSNSELSHPHMLNGHSDILTGLHPLQLDPSFSNSLLNTSTGLSLAHPGTIDNKLYTNGSMLSTLFYNMGQASSNTSPQPQTFPVASISGSNTSEEIGLMSNSGGLNNNHWLLNSPDVLSQFAYQNGFLMNSQVNNSYTNSFIGKYPMQDINSELSLGSGNSISCNAENMMCGANEQPVHNINISNGPSSTLQQTNSVKVIVQEGAS
ncbi:INO80 complex subunit D [Caerostris darwini]|uniref:INO80 complex subunit D n=1 Tax=Caerostris darwini TaxID=1538125 RepID=A0AAV4U1C7_9ARAC|nr:INO80 complex subunit D [Caerostris darwini]